jgi:hypothetical protein
MTASGRVFRGDPSQRQSKSNVLTPLLNNIKLTSGQACTGRNESRTAEPRTSKILRPLS